MMGYFMRQLDCATECPDIWLNIILSVFMRVFLEEKHLNHRQCGFPGGSVPGLPHCRQRLYHLSHQRSW